VKGICEGNMKQDYGKWICEENMWMEFVNGICEGVCKEIM